MRHEIERAHRLGKTFLYELDMNLAGEEVGFISEMGKHPDGEERKRRIIRITDFSPWPIGNCSLWRYPPPSCFSCPGAFL